MELIHTVKAGTFKTADSPSIIVTHGLGSCVAVCIYDTKKRVGGLAHIMLPKEYTEDDLEVLRQENIDIDNTSVEVRYADVAIDWMTEELLTRGANVQSLVVKIVGGAEMFAHITKGTGLGVQNVHSVKEYLLFRNLPLIAEETGGTQGRTLSFFLEDGSVRVESSSNEQLI